IRYRKAIADRMPLHGRRGQITRVGRGPGPINCEVYVRGHEPPFVVVPRGNLFLEETP
ncbi:MAG: hypothetical protein IMZ66_11815, partial [Planctomycetes bacterium]|nr:hypothetical protein [Planctomycetota bacterium]